MVAPSLRVPVVTATTGAANGTTTSPALTIDATAVAGDIAWVTATFTAGVDTANPATHDPASLSLAGWTPSAQIQSTNDTSTTRTFTKTLAAGDIGSQVSVSSNVSGRVGIELGIVKGAASVSVQPGTIQMGVTTFTVPGFTPPANETFAVATAGFRWPSSVTAPAVPAVTGWTELVDSATSNSTGQKASIWAASRTPSGTTAVPSASASTPDGPTYGATILLFTPATGTVTASAGANRTVEADTTVTLTGTTTGGSGSLSAQSWTQTSGPAVTLTPVSGDPASVTFVSPLLVAGTTLGFQYAVTDTNGTSASGSTTVTVTRARLVVNVGGVLKPVRRNVPPPVHPPVPATKLASPFYGGGGQSAFAWSPFSTSKCAVGSDTGGVRTSDDGTRTSSLALLGLDGLRAKQSNGLAFSSVVDGVQFMTCGDSTAGTGGVYVRTGAFGSAVSAWTRLDGVLAGTPQLTFNGGNNNLSTTPGAPVQPNNANTALVAATYPRMYGGALLRDDTAITGRTILYVATTGDGAWRFVLNNADWSVLEQVRVPGTAGILARCVAWGSKDHTKVVVGLYDSRTPQSPVMVTNAIAPVGTTLTTTTMTSSPKNIENLHLLPAPTASGMVSLAVAVTGKNDLTSQTGSVWLATNLESAAPASVTWTDCAKSYGSGASTAPEDDEWWFSAGGTTRQVSGVWQHRIFVGTASGRRTTVSGVQRWNTMWVGTVPASSATPATDITWKTPTFSEQVLGLPGNAWKWWLSGINTPMTTGTAAVSGFRAHPSDPNLIAATCKGNTYISTDGGDTWNASAIGGTADHNAAWWSEWNPLRMLTTTGDWPLAASVDKSPAKTFDQQPNAVLQVSSAAGQGGTTDPMTGDVFIMVTTSGAGHTVPAADPNNALLSYTDAGMDNTVVDLAGATNWSLPKDVNGTSASAIMAMQIVYGPTPSSGSRKGAIIAGRDNGLGMWARSSSIGTSGWTRVTAPSGNNPFTNSPAAVYDLFDSCRDNTRSIAFFLERGNGVVWRVNVDQTGAASAVRLFQQGWAYSVSEGVGFVDYDTANDILWVATKTGVYWLTGASTSPHVTGTADTLGAFQSAPWSTYYPGEIPGPMRWSAATSSLWVHTQHFATASSAVYPTNGSNGPRSLLIANPTTASSWQRSVVNDLAISRDPQLRTGLVYPKGCSRNADGSVITIQQQGSGLYVLRLA